MPCISGQYDTDVGILLQVGLAPGGRIEDIHQRAHVTSDTHAQVVASRAQALVDTGASKTSMSRQMADDLALGPSGLIEVQGVTGSTKVNTYYVDFILSFGPQSLVVAGMEVCEFDPGMAPFQVLIGRDIIGRGVLTMDFSGRFTFSI